jgi:serine-type D-Ala-D-Ala carboxypeptidase/endopeptidase (penicillin-binding protein 4)
MRLRRACAVVLLAAVAVLGSTATGETEAASPDLATALGRALLEPGVDPRRTAAVVLDLRTGHVVFERRADLALAPASAEKLAVSFAALRVLGPGFRFRTEVVGSGELAGRTWRGTLFLVGHGDPTLARADLEGLAREVKSWGIRHVTGRVLGDERHFDARRDGPGWKRSFLGLESAPLSALAVDGVEFQRPDGSAAAASRAFVAALTRNGVSVGGAPGRGAAPDDVLPLAVDYSVPLAELVGLLNRDSDNFAAEIVLKELGAGAARSGTTAAGAEVVEATLAEAGIPVTGVRIADGSGLSARDRLTARALLAILRAADGDSAIRGPFVTSLAVAGVSGTLKRRLERRPARGLVIAKTGTTSRASALAGFIRRRYAFAILQNGSPLPYWSARAAQDRFVTILARS